MIGGTLRDWKQTELWKLIAERSQAGDQVRVAIEQYMPAVQAIVEQGGTASPDMTLHDAQHAARVADRMVEIVPERTLVGLSVLELAMLLFSAYLHDIGMTPERRRRVALYDYLLTGEGAGTTETERTEFKLWVEDRYAGTPVPLVSGEPLTSHDLRFADEVTDYFVRYKHNEWSATWVRKHMASPQTAPFAGWEEVLIDLAQSHHWGRTELAGAKLKPQMIGEQLLNLRYLACVLRVADILEADPSRSAPILFEHRQPVDASRIYWQKDHGLSVNLVRGDSAVRRVVVFARPSSAHAHHEILKYVDDIESELRTCRFISDEHPFTHLPGVDQPLPYAWDLAESVSLTISGDLPYEYIDGTFRTDSRRLLELVSGSRLYESEFAAVRELLQNAFDAVKEQIAYERLNASNPSDDQTEEIVAARLKVKLTLQEREGRWHLVCDDRGVGMTKAIIASHFLVEQRTRDARRTSVSFEDYDKFQGAIVQIDWVASSAAGIRLSRESITLTDPAREAVATLQRLVGEWKVDLIRRADALVRRASEAVLGPVDQTTQFMWPVMTPDNGEVKYRMRTVEFPVTSKAYFRNREPWNLHVTYENRPVTLLPTIPYIGEHQGLWWHGGTHPSKIVLAKSNVDNDGPIAIWTGCMGSNDATLGPSASFPPVWSFLVGVRDYADSINSRHFLNTANSLVRLATEDATNAMRGAHGLDGARTKFERKPERAAAWFVLRLGDSYTRPGELWNGLLHAEPELMHALWRALQELQPEINELRYYTLSDHGVWGYQLTPVEARYFQGESAPNLPDPGPEWTVNITAVAPGDPGTPDAA